MSHHQLDIRALYTVLDVCRQHNELTWRDLAERTGISPSTFSRMVQGHKPDVDALCSLIAWLRVPLDRFITPAPASVDVPLPEEKP